MCIKQTTATSPLSVSPPRR